MVRTFYREKSPPVLSRLTPTPSRTVLSVILPAALWNRSLGIHSFLSLLALQSESEIPTSLLLIRTEPTSFPICRELKLSTAVQRHDFPPIMALLTLTLLNSSSCISDLLAVPMLLLTTVPTSPGLRLPRARAPKQLEAIPIPPIILRVPLLLLSVPIVPSLLVTRFPILTRLPGGLVRAALRVMGVIVVRFSSSVLVSVPPSVLSVLVLCVPVLVILVVLLPLLVRWMSLVRLLLAHPDLHVLPLLLPLCLTPLIVEQLVT